MTPDGRESVIGDGGRGGLTSESDGSPRSALTSASEGRAAVPGARYAARQLAQYVNGVCRPEDEFYDGLCESCFRLAATFERHIGCAIRAAAQPLVDALREIQRREPESDLPHFIAEDALRAWEAK